MARHIGIENAKILSDNVKNINNLIVIIEKKQIDNFLNIDGIGETQINSLKNYFSNKLNLSILIELSNMLNIEKATSNKSRVLKNKTFMFTGKLEGLSRAEAKTLIEKNSGITLSSITKNLNYLVIGQKPTKRKIDQAKKLDVKVISQKELKKLLN